MISNKNTQEDIQNEKKNNLCIINGNVYVHIYSMWKHESC